MKANGSWICRFLDGADKKFIIPVYQRSYSWEKSDCKKLFDDLMAVYHENYSSHFFGSLVYVMNDTGGCQEYQIIDGQQRITTVSILLIAIRNYIKVMGIDVGINPEKITDAYLQDRYAPNENKLKLKLVKGDDLAYDRLLNDQEISPDSSISVNYRYFYEKVSNLSMAELKGLYDAVMKLEIVNISLSPSNGDDPQLIFESLNSTGQDLKEADKIRNYVLMNMDSSSQEQFYKKYWEVLERKVPGESINDFIRYYLAVKNRDLSNMKKLYFTFKRYIEDNDLSKESVLEDMIVYAGFYRDIIAPEYSNRKCAGVLTKLRKLGVNSMIPLLFDLMKYNRESTLTDDELEKSIKIIESFIIRREICGLQANALNKLFVSIGAEIEKYIERNNISCYEAFKYALLSKKGKSRFPDDHDFEDKFEGYELYNAKRNIQKYIFEELENYGTKERIAVEEQIDDGTLTIEHIMPQTMNDDWKEALGENWEFIHSKYIDTIGNLTLTAYNSDYSNLSFAKKKTMSRKGFAYSKLSLNDYVKKCDAWGEREISERAGLLQKNAADIWRRPETSYMTGNDDNWVSWDDDYDFTNHSIEKIRLLGDEIVVKDVTDAFKKVNMRLYSEKPVEYRNFDCKYISEDETAFRRPVEVGDEIYVETNLSSQAKMEIIQGLMGYLDYDSNDLILLVSKTFDVNDETTYNKVTPGKLAYCLIKDLADHDKITDEEVDLLKTKEYTRDNFRKMTYPVLADYRTDNMGAGKKIRYKKDPVTINGKEQFVTSEWYEESKKDLINWYRTLK